MWELLGFVALAYLALFLLAVALHQLRYQLVALPSRRAALGPIAAIAALLGLGALGAPTLWPWWAAALVGVPLGLLGLFWVTRAAELHLSPTARLGLSAAVVAVMALYLYQGVLSGWENSGLSQFL